MMPGNNLLNINGISKKEENFFSLFSNKEILVERIVSFGQITNDDMWLEQKKNEWVALLQGEAEILFEKDNNKVSMKNGDYIHIPSRCKHKVTFTSCDPPCIWLAVHF